MFSISRYYKSEIYRTLAQTFIARIIAAAGGILLILVISKLYGTKGVGIYSLAQGVYFGASIIARYGMNHSLMRYVGQNNSSIGIVSYLKWSIVRSTFLSVLLSVAIFFSCEIISYWFDTPQLKNVLIGVVFSIPAFTLTFIIGGFMKGIHKPAAACLLENGTVSLVACGLLLVLNSFYPNDIGLIGWSFSIAAWLILLQGIYQASIWLKNNKLQYSKDTVTKKQFLASSNVFFIMSLAIFLQQVVSVFIAGLMLTPSDLGLFKTAERVAFIISFILVVLNAVLPPRFASYYQSGDIASLEKLAQKGLVLALILASPALALCIVAPSWILSIFGEEFKTAGTLLQIIAIAQLVNVATGSVSFILTMTGHERLMRNIAIISSIVGLILFLFFIPLWGALGAALALSMSLIMQNLAALYYVWSKLGIWILPKLK